MSSPHDQYNAEIKRLIRQGCSPNQALQQLTTRYPQLMDQAAQVLKNVQKIERELRQSDNQDTDQGFH
jgi:hypothetical protein